MAQTISLSAFPALSALAETDALPVVTSAGAKSATFAKLAEAVRSSIRVGGRNLLKGTSTPKTNTSYTLAKYELTEAPNANEECVLTLWGSLGEGRSKFSAFNTGGTVWLGELAKIQEGIYQIKFKWPKGLDTHVWIFQNPQTATAESTITRAKLERGNVGSDWAPAPEDLAASLSGGG